MIKYMVSEMEDTLVDLKSSCAAKIAEKTRVEEEFKELAAVAARWTARAELAVEKGKDDLAREALLERQKAEHAMGVLKEDITHLDSIISECRSNTVKLEEKLQKVEERQRILIQRGIHAQETILAKEKIKRAEDSDAYRRFEEFEQRIEQMEADAEMADYGLKNEKEDEFFSMEHEDSLEAELAELKKKASAKRS